MDSDRDQANVSAMDETRVDNGLRSIYSMTRNPTTEDFATILGERFKTFEICKAFTMFFTGFMNAQPETMLFANLNELEKLMSCCHLVS
jgi:hypothetical protein